MTADQSIEIADDSMMDRIPLACLMAASTLMFSDDQAKKPSSSLVATYKNENDAIPLQHAGLPQNTSLTINTGNFQSVELAAAGWWLAHERYVFQATAMTFEKATCMHTVKMSA